MLYSLRQMELMLKTRPNGSDAKKIRPQNHSMSIPDKESKKNKGDNESHFTLPALNSWNSPLKMGRKNSPLNGYNSKNQYLVNDDAQVTTRKLESMQSARNIKIKSLQIQNLANIYINPPKK